MEHPTDAMRRTIAEQHDEIAALRAENAKLRDGAYAMRQLYEDELKHALGENAKLREEFRKMDEWHSKELSAAMAENAKLRELVRDYERCTMHADCAGCEYDGKLSTHCPLSPCFPDADELCELRIEVDE